MKKYIIGIMLISLEVAMSQASAVQLFGTVLPGGGKDDPLSTLVELNPETGNLIRYIGEDIGYQVNGLTYDETTDTLYATTSDKDEIFSNGLLVIDLETGVGSPVEIEANQEKKINNLTSNSIGELYGWTKDSDDLILWNKEKGTVIVLGDSGITAKKHGLAFDNADFLFIFNGAENLDLSLIDTINSPGAATLLGSISDTQNSSAHHGDFHPETNLYYGLDATLGVSGGSISERNILLIHTGTKAVVSTLATIDKLHTITFIPTKHSPAGECNNIKGINISDIICIINRVLSGE